MTSVTLKVVGATGGIDLVTGKRPFRYEVNQFSTSGPPFDLFILALRHIQSLNQSDALSYFQIAGIHGYPRIPWDGVVGTGPYPGYCVHASVTFPAWHRPYLALYEQAIWSNAQSIARSFPLDTRSQYEAAALSLRIPYWDWAINSTLPDVVTRPTIAINTPDGQQIIDNPLFKYTFQSNAEGNGFPTNHPMSKFPWTVRWWNATAGQGNQSAATAALSANGPSILAMTYQLFSTITDYTSFSSTWPGGKSNTANNIENIHNSIHNSIGGWGHMQFPEVSAFDPTFWLHHANVDRLFAMWQALNPTQYIVPTTNMYGSYFEPRGTVSAGNTSLAPFHSDNGTTMFTSDGVRSLRTFGYTYPELPDWNMSEPEISEHVRREVNRLYNPFPAPSNATTLRTRYHKRAHPILAFGNIDFDIARNIAINNLDMQWSIRIDIARYAYDSNFAIYFFMGNPPENIDQWPMATNLIGSHGQFIASNLSQMHSGTINPGRLQGEISLTHILAAAVRCGIIMDLCPDSVVPLLEKGLEWRAKAADGCEIDLYSLFGLSIAVVSREVVPATSLDEFPEYGDPCWHEAVTRGKPGGARLLHRLVRDETHSQ